MNEKITEFQSFNKLARLNREIVITEKLDGTNAQILLVPTAELFAGSSYPDATAIEDFSKPGSVVMFVGSRNRWITPGNDNYGFARWCMDNVAELRKLGPGRHFGEWWGGGIQRGYGLKEKRFSLFNVGRWESSSDEGFPGVFQREPNSLGITVPGPGCCHVVPTLWRGNFSSFHGFGILSKLKEEGSIAAPGFMKPEGIVIYHTAQGNLFKVTLENDETPKSLIQ